MAPTLDPLFHSFFLAGFECASQRRNDGQRLDLLAATVHDRFARQDYAQMAQFGIRTVRDGLRWHLIEAVPGHYDWSSFLPMLRAADAAGLQVVWDLCHYGWPDDIDIWSSAFVDRFAQFAGNAARLIRDETATPPIYCPINEISFWAWAGGEVGYFNPAVERRGAALKQQLVRAAIAATRAIRETDPRARFISAEPLINVAGRGGKQSRQAREYTLAQYEAADMLVGRLAPELGGSEDCLDVLGVNFYPDNQWYLGGSTIPMGHHAFRALSDMLVETHQRYGRPILIAETGAEGSARAAWLHYVCSEVREAHAAGVPVGGVCLYPILDYPGWENGRSCPVGLLSQPRHGIRRTCLPFAAELQRQQSLFTGEPWTLQAAADANPQRAAG